MINKNIVKRIFFEASLLLSFAAYAEEQIVLPEVTTVVSGDSLTIGLDSLPPFSDIQQIVTEKNEFLPVLPDVNVDTAVMDESFVGPEQKSNDAIHFGADIGGGYPNLFYGTVKIFKNTKSNSFYIDFFTEDYFRNISGRLDNFSVDSAISANDSIKLDNTDLSFSIDYRRSGYCLQNDSSIFDAVYTQSFYNKDAFSWTLSDRINLDSTVNIDVSDYILESTGSLDYDVYLSPDFTFTWTNDYVDTVVYTNYVFDTLNEYFLNRGFINCQADLKIGRVILTGGAGVVLFNDEFYAFNALPVFLVGVSTPWFSVSGGIESTHRQYRELFADLKYVETQKLLYETSDWVLKAKTSIPLSDFLSIYGNADLRKTVFDNGFYDCDNSSVCVNGLYQINQYDRFSLDTLLGFAICNDIISLDFGWNALWLYTPSNRYQQTMKLDTRLNDKSNKKYIHLVVTEPLGKNADYVPIIDSEFGIKCRKELTLKVNVTDAVKIFSSNPRRYYGSAYSSKSGAVSLGIELNI